MPTLANGVLIIALACLICSCASYPPLAVVDNVDLNRYLGKWYEIASLPVSQQEGCSCTTAEYSLMEDGVIKVVNACKKKGTVDMAEGKAFIVPNSGNAKLKVQFFWPFRGDYWIIELDKDYQYAVVGVPNRKYFWILSRTPEMSEATLEMLVDRVMAKGFDTSKMQRTVHDCGAAQ
jgi:apolipoprotein D and lipocalin family protein